MTVGERIKERRKQIGMNAETLAKILEVSPSTIYRYESGSIEKMGIDKLKPIADALNTDVASLMGWADEQEKPLINDDEELTEYIDMLKNRSECRMLFNLTKSATKEQVEAIVKLIETTRGISND